MALTSQQLKGQKKLHSRVCITVFVLLLLAFHQAQGIILSPCDEVKKLKSSFLTYRAKAKAKAGGGALDKELLLALLDDKDVDKAAKDLAALKLALKVDKLRDLRLGRVDERLLVEVDKLTLAVTGALTKLHEQRALSRRDIKEGLEIIGFGKEFGGVVFVDALLEAYENEKNAENEQNNRSDDRRREQDRRPRDRRDRRPRRRDSSPRDRRDRRDRSPRREQDRSRRDRRRREQDPSREQDRSRVRRSDRREQDPRRPSRREQDRPEQDPSRSDSPDRRRRRSDRRPSSSPDRRRSSPSDRRRRSSPRDRRRRADEQSDKGKKLDKYYDTPYYDPSARIDFFKLVVDFLNEADKKDRIEKGKDVKAPYDPPDIKALALFLLDQPDLIDAIRALAAALLAVDLDLRRLDLQYDHRLDLQALAKQDKVKARRIGAAYLKLVLALDKAKAAADAALAKADKKADYLKLVLALDKANAAALAKADKAHEQRDAAAAYDYDDYAKNRRLRRLRQK